VLREISGVRQDDPDRRRRWFQDDYFDLFVWAGASGEVTAFQLAYERGRDEHVLEWDSARGYLHCRVEERRDGFLAIPGAALLGQGKRFPKYRVLSQFDARSAALEPAIRRAVRGLVGGFNNPRPHRSPFLRRSAHRL
jgi:hypothetical protein